MLFVRSETRNWRLCSTTAVARCLRWQAKELEVLLRISPPPPQRASHPCRCRQPLPALHLCQHTPGAALSDFSLALWTKTTLGRSLLWFSPMWRDKESLCGKCLKVESRNGPHKSSFLNCVRIILFHFISRSERRPN